MCKHVCLSKYIGKTIFVDFYIFYGILFQSKRPSFKSLKFSVWLQPVDRPVDRSLKSVDRVGRPTCTDVHAFVHWRAGRPRRSTARELVLSGKPRSTERSTDVHRRARQFWQEAGRPTRSTVQRALLSGKAPIDRAVDRTESTALCILATVDRPVDRWLNGLKYDRWPVDRQFCQTPTASFSIPINLGVWVLF